MSDHKDLPQDPKAARDAIRHSNNIIQVTIDDEQLHFFFSRYPHSSESLMDMLVKFLKEQETVNDFLQSFWDEDIVERFSKLLIYTLDHEKEAPVMKPEEAALYRVFVLDGKLTEEQFRDNFSTIYSTTMMGDDKRYESQLRILEEIKAQYA